MAVHKKERHFRHHLLGTPSNPSPGPLSLGPRALFQISRTPSQNLWLCLLASSPSVPSAPRPLPFIFPAQHPLTPSTPSSGPPDPLWDSVSIKSRSSNHHSKNCNEQTTHSVLAEIFQKGQQLSLQNCTCVLRTSSEPSSNQVRHGLLSWTSLKRRRASAY